MNPNLSDLLGQGLVITILGMGLVFLALLLIWGLMALLGRVFKLEPAASEEEGTPPSEAHIVITPAIGVEAQTAERARVAALVAGALMANALPLHMEAPIGPAFEHGRTAPIWVMANRARSLCSWQTPRATDPVPGTQSE